MHSLADNHNRQPYCECNTLEQERMANNHVYVFRKSQPSKYSHIAECRCADVAWVLTWQEC